MNKFLLKLRNLSLEINCITLIFLLISCNLDNQRISKSECRECERELLKLDTYKKINESRLSRIDSIFQEIQHIDSSLSKRILQNQRIQKDDNKTIITMELPIDDYIEKSTCKNQSSKKRKLESNLKWLKSTEIKCDNYLNRIQFYAKKDSAYREMLNLEFIPFEILFKANNTNSNKNDSLLQLDYTKQLDSKIQKLLWQIFMISRSYNEINEYKARN
jgi:hypothetical protein